MTSRLIDPELLDLLALDFLPERGKIQQAVKTQSTTGQQKDAFEDVPGWVNIPCRVAPMGGSERRYPTQTFLDATDTAILAGTFNGLDETMIFICNGRTYEIVRVESDSEGVTTRLTLRTAR